ncbi:protein BCAP-like isoform X1 [Polypterus senegalus]|uniref:protein BCAP-like isoform X1 n=2 Tax=Polypterus senegalus TaxID=55291 RepID=UPI00196379CD|nr:protein BCAP-like isoform X1 [Polypterus senegalus]
MIIRTCASRMKTWCSSFFDVPAEKSDSVQEGNQLPAAMKKAHQVTVSVRDPETVTKKNAKKTVVRDGVSNKKQWKCPTPRPSIPTQTEKPVIEIGNFGLEDNCMHHLQIDSFENEHHGLENQVSESKLATLSEQEPEAPVERQVTHSVKNEGIPQENADMLQSPEPGRLEKEGNDFNKSGLLKLLIEVEIAANSAEVQLVSFKDSFTGISNDVVLSSSDITRMSRQKKILLEKLEKFKTLNKTLQQLLKDMQSQEKTYLQAEKHIDVLLKKLSETENENMVLKRKMQEKLIVIEELTELRKKDKDDVDIASKLFKSVEETRAHLQGQLRIKESENNRITVQLRGMERKITEQKLEIESLRSQISILKDKSHDEKEALKKATKAQKQRAEYLELAVDKCRIQIEEKDVLLSEALSAANKWKSNHAQTAAEKFQLEAKIGTLEYQFADLNQQLQKASDGARTSDEEMLQKMSVLKSENTKLNVENSRLKVSLATLEGKVAQSEAEVELQKEEAKKYKDLVEQYKMQIKNMQEEAEELKIRCEKIFRGNSLSKEKQNTDLTKEKNPLEARVMELEVFPDLLKAAEQRLCDCQDSLMSYERRFTENSNTISQLQVKLENQTQSLNSSLRMVESLQEEKDSLGYQFVTLHRQIEDVQSENRDLVRKLSSQEEALRYSEKQLEERSAECLALTRQLEAALTDVRKQVPELKDMASSRETALQSKILELESDNSRKQKELKHLKQAKQTAENLYEMRLKEMQKNLEESENHKQSIQNYVDFLKKSYSTMFGEGFSPGFAPSF